MAFKFRLLPSLITIPAIIFMLMLGFWQIERLKWKSQLIDILMERTSRNAVELSFDDINKVNDEFTPVYIYGKFDYSHELLLQNRTYEKQAGMHLLTPFIITASDKINNTNINKAILVDRGWLPFAKTDGPFHKDSHIDDIIKLEGVVRFPTGQTSFIPDNMAAKNQWYFIDLEQISSHTGYDFIDYYIMANNNGDMNNLPIGGRWKINLPNNHLEYAITWYSLAFILLVIFLIYHRKKK